MMVYYNPYLHWVVCHPPKKKSQPTRCLFFIAQFGFWWEFLGIDIDISFDIKAPPVWSFVDLNSWGIFGKNQRSEVLGEAKIWQEKHFRCQWLVFLVPFIGGRYVIYNHPIGSIYQDVVEFNQLGVMFKKNMELTNCFKVLINWLKWVKIELTMIKTSRKWLIYGLHKFLVAIVASSYNVIGHTMQHD